MNIRNLFTSYKLIQLLLFPVVCYAQPAWDAQLNFEDIAYRLEHEPLVKNVGFATYLERQGKRAHGNNNMRLIELESGLLGLFKPGEYGYAEVAAYKASKALHLRLVPPTVLRTIDGKKGSLQFYIVNGVNSSDQERYLKKLDPKVIHDMKLFYYIFGQWDIHPGNQVLAVSNGKPYLALIDNAGMLHLLHGKIGERPFIEKGSAKGAGCSNAATFPYDEIQSVHSSDRSRMTELFGNSIPKQLSRLMSVPHTIRYVFWRDILWMEAKHALGAIGQCHASTIKALKDITLETMREVWSDWRGIQPAHAEQLAVLTVERRDHFLTVTSIS